MSNKIQNKTEFRWMQRLQNFQSALSQLREFMNLKSLNKFEQQGLIQCFEYNYELAWNVIKDFYIAQGEQNIQGSRDTFRIAFKRGLIINGEIWMEMIKSRSLTSHTYNEITANEIITKITEDYFKEFILLEEKLLKEKEKYFEG